MSRAGHPSSWTVGALIALVLTTGFPVISADAEAPASMHDPRWREPLDRAETALAQGEPRRAERAWEEAHRAAIRPTIPASGLVDVGLAYLRIGEAAHDRQTAVTRARQLFLRALFRARDRRDVQGLTAVSQAFAGLGDCEVAARSYAVALRVERKQAGAQPSCEPLDTQGSPSASPRSNGLSGRERGVTPVSP